MKISVSIMLRVFLFGLMLYFCLAFNILAQINKANLPSEVLDRILALAYVHKLDEKDVQKILLSLEKAVEQDFPVNIMALKIEEGLSKKITIKRIISTLDIMLKQLERLDAVLKNLPTDVRMNRKKKLNIMTGLVAMGIEPDEIEDCLAKFGKFPPEQIFKALETKAALSRVGLNTDEVEGIIEQGLTSGFFCQHGCRNVALLAHAASRMGIDSQSIYRISIQIVSGKKTLDEAAGELGIERHGHKFCRRGCDTGNNK
jgi:hypothetical protein